MLLNTALPFRKSTANAHQNVKVSLYRTSVFGKDVLLGSIMTSLVDFEPRNQGNVSTSHPRSDYSNADGEQKWIGQFL